MENEIEKKAYMIAKQRALLMDAYIRLHVKPKPKYLPNFIYMWMLKKFIKIVEFKKP